MLGVNHEQYDPAKHLIISDAACTTVMDGDLVKVLPWYNNEWGCPVRCVDLVAHMASKGL